MRVSNRAVGNVTGRLEMSPSGWKCNRTVGNVTTRLEKVRTGVQIRLLEAH